VSPRWSDHTELLASEGAGRQGSGERPGKRLRAIRAQRGITRAEVARASGFSVREVARIERNGTHVMFEDWRALAGGLGVDVRELAPPDAKSDGVGIESEDPDDIPLDLVDLELDEFIARVHGDTSGTDVVMTAALAELDTDPVRHVGPQRFGHRRATTRSSNEFRRRLTVLDDLCTQFVRAKEHDAMAALAAQIAMAAERVRSCREFRAPVATPSRRR
jgi:transcriptional regulator with XRE-family HTH domain